MGTQFASAAAPRSLVVVDDKTDRSHRFVRGALDPGGATRRVTAAEVWTTKELETLSLDLFQTIYLVDVARLTEKQAAALEKRVRAGAGLCCFAGERVDAAVYNRLLYRDGKGWLPAPLGAAVKLPPKEMKRDMDVQLTRHAAFNLLLQESFQPLLSYVIVKQHRQAGKDWKPDAMSGSKVIATLRGEKPLVIEKNLGRGRVLLWTTAPNSKWTNWPLQPSWVVMMLEMQAYLAK